MNQGEDERTASGLALVDFRLGLIETNIDTLGRKFDDAVSRLPTVETLNLVLAPYSQQINGIQQDIKEIQHDVETLQELKPTVTQLQKSEEARAGITRQLKLVIVGAIISPIVAVIISALTVFFTVQGGA